MLVDGKILPDAYIVGAAKSGTTSIYKMLDSHSSVFSSRLKEPYFHSYRYKDDSYVIAEKKMGVSERVLHLEDYLALYEKAGAKKCVIDASTQYLYDYEAFEKSIKEVYSEEYRNVKVIVVVRDPAERAWSHFCMHRRDGKENLDFERAIEESVVKSRIAEGYPESFDYIGFSCYSKGIRRLEKEFPNFRIIKFSEVGQERAIRGLIDFLGLDQEDVFSSVRMNASGQPRGILGKIFFLLLKKKSGPLFFLKRLVPTKLKYNLKVSILPIVTKRVNLSLSDKSLLMSRLADEYKALESMGIKFK